MAAADSTRPPPVQLAFPAGVFYDIASDSLGARRGETREAVFDANPELAGFDILRQGDDITLAFGLWEEPHRIDFRLLGSKHDFYRLSMGVRLDETLARLAQADPNVEAAGVERAGEGFVLRLHYAWPAGRGPPKPVAPRTTEPAATPEPAPKQKPESEAGPGKTPAAKSTPGPPPAALRPPPGAEAEVAVAAPSRPPLGALKPRVTETVAPRPPRSEVPAAAPGGGVEAAYQGALREGSLQALVRFIGSYPNAPQTAAASRQIEQMREQAAYRKAVDRDDIAGYREFLEHFPDSSRRSEVELRIRTTEKETRQAEADRRARAAEERKARAAAEKRARVAKGEKAKAAEERRRSAFGEAERSDTPEAYRVFLTAYSDGPEAEEARRRIMGIEEDESSFPGPDGSEEELKRYLAERPAGRRAAEARELLSVLRTARMNSEWEKAMAGGSEEDLSQFLIRWPQSPRTGEAKAKLEALRKSAAEAEPPAEHPPSARASKSHELVLEAPRAAKPPSVDGDPSDAAWRNAPALEVPLHGPTHPGSLLVRAVHADETLYLRIEWADATRDITYRPWVWDSARKTYNQSDRVDDAVAAVLYPGAPPGDSCMLAGNDREADVWMWRAHRSEISDFADDGRIRVSGARLPRSNSYPTGKGGGQVWIRKEPDSGSPGWSFFVPLVFQERDVVPSYRRARASGSRGDVRAQGKWSPAGESGVWTVELARVFDTGHPDDVPVDAEEHRALAFAVYDKEEKGRHASSAVVLLEIQGR